MAKDALLKVRVDGKDLERWQNEAETAGDKFPAYVIGKMNQLSSAADSGTTTIVFNDPEKLALYQAAAAYDKMNFEEWVFSLLDMSVETLNDFLNDEAGKDQTDPADTTTKKKTIKTVEDAKSAVKDLSKPKAAAGITVTVPDLSKRKYNGVSYGHPGDKTYEYEDERGRILTTKIPPPSK